MLRFARRCGWIVTDPVGLLERDERPQPTQRRQRVLGRAEIERLLGACAPRDRLMVTTVLCTGLRISELLGLVWDDIDFAAGVIHVRAQLSRAHHGAPARRVAPKTPASFRDVPLVPQLARLLNAHRQGARSARGADWVFATTRGTPYGHRNVSRRALGRAAQLAGLNDDGWPPLRFHDLRHTFASHLIVDLRARPSPGQPHPRPPHTSRSRSTSTRTCSRTHATRKTSEPAWPPAPSAGLLEPATAAPGATVLKLR